MQANFALWLSPDGIRLLRRVADDWSFVGEVSLDVPDLGSALAELRDAGLAGASEEMRTKLIIPDAQIRYISIDGHDAPPQARHEEAMAALDGATPYPIDDLAFDVANTGSRTCIAAVALETLTEAETFAFEHGFAPICWVGPANEGGFVGEPFFGHTAYARTLLPATPRAQADGLNSPTPLVAQRAQGEVQSEATALAPTQPLVLPASTFVSADDTPLQEMAQSDRGRNVALAATALLLMFLVGIAAWASIFLDETVARLLNGSDAPEDRPVANIVVDHEAPSLELTDAISGANATAPSPVAALTSSAERPAVPTLVTVAPPEPFSGSSALEFYAVTGIWRVSPEMPRLPSARSESDVTLASVSPGVVGEDVVALPRQSTLDTDPLPALPQDALGTTLPNATFTSADPSVDEQFDIAAFRPRARPSDFIEQLERERFSGLTYDELAAFRPRTRPDTVPNAEPEQEERPEIPDIATAVPTDDDADDAEPNFSTSPLAVVASLRPETRPGDMAQIVARAQDQATRVAIAPSAIEEVTSATRSGTRVAREATEENVVNLSRINLMGVYGSRSDRRALVRLQNGRFRKVKVGDRLDGGRISAIGETELRYQKRGRNVVLRMPRS